MLVGVHVYFDACFDRVSFLEGLPKQRHEAEVSTNFERILNRSLVVVSLESTDGSLISLN